MEVFAADLQRRFDDARGAGVLTNLHGVVVARGEDILFETYLAGTDSIGPRPLGVVRFGPETLHDLRSITKSIVGLLYGIALGAGLVPPPEATLLEQFPEYPDLAADPARQALTVAHALTMTLGTEWDEMSLPYSDPRNSEIAMSRAPDRTRYVLERPVLEPPGQRWIYNGGATQVLGQLIAKGVGASLEAYAEAVLFAPLGIAQAEWWPTRAPSPASGLRLTPRDLARIGAMILAGGRWQGRQIVPEDWLKASFTPSVSLLDGRHYGYHWYLGATPRDGGAGDVIWERTVSGMGNGGQRLALLPRLDLSVAITAGNYNDPDGWRPSMNLLRDVLLPAFR